MELECQICEFKGNLQQVRIYHLGKSYATICNNCFVDEINKLTDFIHYDKGYKELVSRNKNGDSVKYEIQDNMIRYMDALTKFQRGLDIITNQYNSLVEDSKELTLCKQRLKESKERLLELAKEQEKEGEINIEVE